MAKPQAEHARRVVGYYRSPESRLAYRLLLGGTKHFGYYPEGAGRLLRARAAVLNCTALVEGHRHREGWRYNAVRARRPVT